MKILIVEDNIEIIELLKIHLQELFHDVTYSLDGKDGLYLALNQEFDLIVLDVKLASLNGFEICKQIRSKKQTPIIMLTGIADEVDKIIGLEFGADDYITKPFSIREFLARIKTVTRRARFLPIIEDTNEKQIEIKDLFINLENRKVLINKQKIKLSPKEFDLLALMASNPGRYYSKEKLLNLVWGDSFEGYEHTVNSHINRLRSKIEYDMKSPQYILTSWGVGYKFNEDIV